jgi:hypothetical protein
LRRPINELKNQPSYSSVPLLTSFCEWLPAGGALAQPQEAPRKHASVSKNSDRWIDIEDILVRDM